MSSSSRSMTGASSEEEAHKANEQFLHEDLHTLEGAQTSAEDSGNIPTESSEIAPSANTIRFQSSSQAADVNNSDTDDDSRSVLTDSERRFKEEFRQRRASPIEGLHEFQVAIKVLMEDIYKAKVAGTGKTFELHHWLSDPATRALFGLYGPKGSTTVDPSWHLFLEMLFDTADNLGLAAAYPMRAQRAVLMAMEQLWSPKNKSLELVLHSIRADLAPEPMFSDVDAIMPQFLDADNFGRFLAGLPPRDIGREVSRSPNSAEQPSMHTPAVAPRKMSVTTPKQSVMQEQDSIQASQPLPRISAVVVAASPVIHPQIQPFLPASTNIPPPIQPSANLPLPIQQPPHFPQTQQPVAAPPIVALPNPAAQPRIRFRKAPRPPYARALIPSDFYDPVQYATNPPGWDAAHQIIAGTSFHGIVGFSNMGLLGPIATVGNLAGDFRACLITKCANGYIQAHHNGHPHFSGAGADHSRIWNWYLALIQGPNGAIEEARFRRYIMARLEQVLPAIPRATVNALRQSAIPLLAAPRVSTNTVPVNSALGQAVAANIAPTVVPAITNSQTAGINVNSANVPVPHVMQQAGPIQNGGPAGAASSTPNAGHIGFMPAGSTGPQSHVLQPSHMGGIDSRLGSNKRTWHQMTGSSDKDASDMEEPRMNGDDADNMEEMISSTPGGSEQLELDQNDDKDDDDDFEDDEAGLPPRNYRR